MDSHLTILDTHLSELIPIEFVGSIPTKWECTRCGKTFALSAMTERDINPKVVVYKQFERHKCASKRSRSAHKSPLHNLADADRRKPRNK